jgi:hypothetical protein
MKVGWISKSLRSYWVKRRMEKIQHLGSGKARKASFLGFLLLAMLMFAYHPSMATIRVEFCFQGEAEPQAVNALKTTIAAHPGYIWSRITPTGRFFSAEFKEDSQLSQSNFEHWLQPLGLSLACYYQSRQHSGNSQAFAEYLACRKAHMADGKTSSFNTCSSPQALCDGSAVNILPWGPGSTLFPSPDGNRNPAYDPFFSFPPWTNTWGTNYGCLQAGELNTIWLNFTITSPGNLEWAFLFPEFDGFNYIYMDWIIWPLNASTCANIAANNAASSPLRCNWNDFPESPNAATGMTTLVSSIPIANESDNFESSVPVLPGNQFLILMDNYSFGNFVGSFDFSLSGTSAGVCSAIMSEGHTQLVAEMVGNAVDLAWVNFGEQPYQQFTIERAANGRDFQPLQQLSEGEFASRPYFQDKEPLGGTMHYRIAKKAADGSMAYSNTVQVQAGANAGFSLSPVPTDGNGFTISAANPGQVHIFDLSGRQVFGQTLEGQAGTWHLEPKLSAGAYWVQLQMPSGERFQRNLLVR